MSGLGAPKDGIVADAGAWRETVETTMVEIEPKSIDSGHPYI